LANTSIENTITIPSEVAVFGKTWFQNSKYVSFASSVPVAQAAEGLTGVNAIFVEEAYINSYKNVYSQYATRIYPVSVLDESKQHFVRNTRADEWEITYYIRGDDAVIGDNITIDGQILKITSVYDHAYRHNFTAAKVNFADTVVSLGSGNFYNNKNITYVNLNSLKTVGADAFSNCSNLAHVVFGDALEGVITQANLDILREEMELLDGAGNAFDLDAIKAGELSPVFFGSALADFGITPFLHHFLEWSPAPGVRKTTTGEVNPTDDFFSGFIFKIQANMNPAHRDRLAFFRVCSGTFQRGMSVTLSRTGKTMKLSQSTQLMANDRETVETAIAGDIIGIYDSGNFQIGDTLTDRKEKLFFEPLPTFPPELFARVRPVNSLKAKQFQKGVQQLAQEGAIQVYHNEFNDVILGAVGQLQFEVFQYRLENEYNSEIRMEPLDYQVARWVAPGSPKDVKDYVVPRSTLVYDHFERPILLFANQYTLNNFMQKNPEVKLVEALEVDDTEHLEA
jgi:peptide chain release factor 3